MVVSGFPLAENPSSGIFSFRSAKALQKVARVSVIHLRAWLPGRPCVGDSNIQGIPVRTVAIPQVPRLQIFNVTTYRQLAWPVVHPLLENCDIIHSVGVDFAGILASPWAQRTQKHHVTQAIGSDVTTVLPKISASRFIAGWEKNIHGVACNTNALMNGFLALYPCVKNARRIPNGVDLESFQVSGPVGGPLANKPPVRYLFLGGFPRGWRNAEGVSIKGGEILLSAWQLGESELVSQGASLLIAGPESKSDRVAQWRAHLRYPNHVDLGGLLPPDTIANYIRASDVVLMPSLREGLPNVVMEASACGRPVFGSNIEGIADVVLHGQTGLLLSPGHIAEWKHTLIRYASQISCLRIMGERARSRVERAFDAKNYVPEMMELYRTALAEPIT
jgi:glycosyltransferase involved in cell wall biosynthesis